MISVMVILDDSDFTETQAQIIHKAIGRAGAWVNVTEKNGRQLFDSVIENESIIPSLEVFLAARNPVLVGKWNEDGSLIGAIDLKEYSDITGATSEVHQFSGWAKREGFSIYG